MKRPAQRRGVIAAGLVVASVAALWPRIPRNAARALRDAADEQAARFEVLSIEPERFSSAAEDAPTAPGPSTAPAATLPTDLFHDHRVLRRVAISDLATRRRLDAALAGGVRTILSPRPMCFNPRHAVHIVNGSHVADFVICFECEQVQAYVDGRRIDWATDDSPRALFDQVLMAPAAP